ncbi:hypothetical protein, partial [Desulfotomaculum sp. 1211_IL3151]|uniref:hypothetical protein n=1 Tax=Desulfotomaculum sp. 1211_IL3151 TaxID=3084055 RepID=UPI002FDB70AE
IKQFMDCVKVPFVWYQLDSFDNDPVKFFEYLVKGLVTALPDFQVILPEFNLEDIKADKKFYRLMVSIINELENKANNGLIIIFDNLHSLKETDVLEFIEYFISYMPSTVHVRVSRGRQTVTKPSPPLVKMVKYKQEEYGWRDRDGVPKRNK